MKIVVTGGKGLLGTDLTQIIKQKGYEVFSFGKAELDVTNFDKVYKAFQEAEPDVVIHAAAFTNVDLAEREQDLAYLINGIGTRNVAVLSEKVGAKLMLISTDYVFDGEKNRPYNEFDVPKPLNIYGHSKLLAETFVKQFHSKWFIVRTSWLFGEKGLNFVKTMIKLAKEKKNIQVVNDQIGSPTYTKDLSEKLIELMVTEKYGVYHISNAGECSWFQFANQILNKAGYTDIKIIPCTTKEINRQAKRPHYSVLDNFALRLNGFAGLRSWEEALKEYMVNNRGH
ncbi:dTDP-4-dehydrorhamnose reductase [Aeribacillus sp. FSL K6-8394]|uniref:dTDP-4-dehydrorhamnose reductase n=1 Tax=Aeribacillus sp. FSL K6-8394 TaxID=2954570 RepID=UPI0030F86CDF